MQSLALRYWIHKYRSKGERSKKVMIGSFSLIISQIISMLTGFVITGLLTRYLAPNEFGLWTLLMSLTGIFAGMDFGFANALRNKISKLSIDKEKNEVLIKNCYFSVFYAFILLALFITSVLLVIKPFIAWKGLFNTLDPSIIRTGSVLFVVGASIFSFNMAFGVSSVGFYGYQESHWNAIIGIIYKILLLLVTSILIKYHASFVIINSTFLFIMLFSTVISFIVFNKKRGWGVELINFRILIGIIRELFSKSMQFVMLQTLAILYSQADLFVISKTLGLETVGNYSLIKKLFLTFSYFQFAFLMPMWSAYGEAVESDDYLWARKILKKSAFYSVAIFTFVMLVFVVSGPFIIRAWTGIILDSRILYLIIGLLFIITAWNNSFSVFLNSANLLKRQIMVSLISFVLFVVLSLILGKNYGLNGICLVLVLTSLPLAVSNYVQTYNYIDGKVR
jgi:O-antigen/teichoic acid export membrane protein